MADKAQARGTGFDSGAYCSAVAGGAQAVAGKEIITGIFSADGTKLLAIDGEQESTITMEAETSEVAVKDVVGGWQVQSPGVKSWELELSTVQLKDSQSDIELRKAFDTGALVCVKQMYADKDFTPICGGSAIVTSYESGAPADDVATASVTLTGTGKLTWFDIDTEAKAQATSKPANRPGVSA